MRNMSFALTTEQIRNRTKTVTRRIGWDFLKPGDIVRAVEKCQGLKKGEKVKPLATLRVVNVRRERLTDITREDVVREGFDCDQSGFIAMFCNTHRIPHGMNDNGTLTYRPVDVTDMVTRIEFEYLEDR